MKSPFDLAAAPVVTPTTFESAGRMSGADGDQLVLALVLRPQGLRDRHHVDAADFEHRQAGAEAAGAHQLHFVLLQPLAFHQEDGERLAGRARIGVAELAALQVLERVDRGFRHRHPDELGHGVHVAADDFQVRAALHRGHHRRHRRLAVRELAAEQVADGGAAAVGGEDAVDVDLELLEIALLHRHGERHAVGGDGVVRHHDLLGRPAVASQRRARRRWRQVRFSWETSSSGRV